MSSEAADGRIRWIRRLQPSASLLSIDEITRRMDETPIAIVVGVDQASTFSAQVTALTAVNLLARLFRRMIVVAPEGATVTENVPFINGALGRALVAFAHRVCAEARVELVNVPPVDAIALHIGDSVPAISSRHVYCLGAGWLARVARHPIPIISVAGNNPVGPLIAAALGSAEVFKLAFGDLLAGILPALDVAFSALTYKVGELDPGPPVGVATLPKTTLVGAGSIGSAFLWGLTQLYEVHGSLTIVDHDVLASHNPDRAILILDGVAARAPAKAFWARDVVKPWLPHLSIIPFRGTVRQYVDTLPSDYRLPFAISAVDSIESRRDIQDGLPEHILNASTGLTKAEISRHESLAGVCLYCLYLPEILERSATQIAMERTGFAQRDVAELMIPGNARVLTEGNVRGIEQHNRLEPGTLKRLIGRRLPELMDALAYSQAPIPLADGQALVTTAFVSGLAGFLLLAETLKEVNPNLAGYRLNGVYEQELLGVPNEFLYPATKDSTGYCLCHSPFRRDLYLKKYGPPR